MGSGLGSSLAPLPTGMSLMQRPSSSSDHHLSPSGHLTPTGMHTHTYDLSAKELHSLISK
jgi:hypothetical protein